MEKLEEARGVKGFERTQQAMEEISTNKSEIDEDKGKTLEEISIIVTQINNTIKERKNFLAPQIKQLRVLRQQFQETESEHNEKKSGFDNAMMGLQR